MISAVPHETYVEPFIGMGGVFLRRPFRPRGEVINDISGDVVTLFRVMQRHPEALIRCMKWQLASREEFNRLNAVDPRSLTDIERAARFVFLQRLAYGGRPHARTFGTQVARPARFDVEKLVPMIEAVHRRLSGVTIECAKYTDVIELYDRPETLFYIDPPYFNCEDYYGPDVFDRADFKALAARIARIKGRFILSLNDVPQVREIFGAFDIQPVQLRYSIARDKAADSRFGEVIITGGGSPLPPSAKTLFDLDVENGEHLGRIS